MLNENIRTIRKAKGLSQQELAVKINVVRQTVSKWEQGMSVPDSDMLLCLSEALETPVSILLGDTVEESEVDELKAIAEKLEIINLQLAQKKEGRQENAAPDFHSSVYNCHHKLRRTGSLWQPVSVLGLQRSGNGRRRRDITWDRMGISETGACSFCGRTDRSSYDA